MSGYKFKHNEIVYITYEEYLDSQIPGFHCNDFVKFCKKAYNEGVPIIVNPFQTKNSFYELIDLENKTTWVFEAHELERREESLTDIKGWK